MAAARAALMARMAMAPRVTGALRNQASRLLLHPFSDLSSCRYLSMVPAILAKDIHLSQCQNGRISVRSFCAPPDTSSIFPPREPVPPSNGKFTLVKSDEEYEAAITAAQEQKKLCVAYFTWDWCRPCRQIAPALDVITHEYVDVIFLKVDVDYQKDLLKIMKQEQIATVPTFKFVRNKRTIAQVHGPEENQIRSTLNRLLRQSFY